MELKNCKARVRVEGNKVYLLIICGRRKERVNKCIEVKVEGNKLETGDGRAQAELPVEVPIDLVARAAQSIGDWFAQRLNEERGRIGYLSEMLVKYIIYFTCKQKRYEGMKLTKCLKETKLKTSRGVVSWKAVYQLFSNTRDLPKELHEPQPWEKDLPPICSEKAKTPARS